MVGIFRIFFGAEGTRPFVVLACLVLAGLAEAISVGSLLPMISKINGEGGGSSALGGFIDGSLTAVGISPTVPTLLMIIVAGLIVKAVLSFAALSYVGFAVSEVATGLRSRLIERLMKVRWAYMKGARIGRIANAISNDATRAGSAYMVSAKFITFMLQGMVYSAIAVAVSWRLALWGLVAGGLIALALTPLVKLSKVAGRKQTARTSDLVTFLSDTLHNIKPLKAMARQDAFVNFLANRTRKLKKSLRNQVIATQAVFYAQEIIVVSFMAVGLYVSVSIWKFSISELMVMGLIFYQVVAIIGKMLRFLQRSFELESAYWSVHKLIDEAANEAESPGGTCQPSLESECVFRDVMFSYPDVPVLKKVNLTVEAGGITVLHGESGAGKTTIIDLLIGFYEPDQGEILIDGTSINDINLTKWRRMIGYIPQELTLFNDTIFANVTLGDESFGEADVIQALKEAGAWDFVRKSPGGIMSEVGEHGTKFSGGQRQRIAIARALVARPKLLILDEVTSALDPDTEREVCRNIQKLAGAYTILSITHRPAWTDIATRVYRVESGQVTAIRQASHRTAAQ